MKTGRIAFLITAAVVLLAICFYLSGFTDSKVQIATLYAFAAGLLFALAGLFLILPDPILEASGPRLTEMIQSREALWSHGHGEWYDETLDRCAACQLRRRVFPE